MYINFYEINYLPTNDLRFLQVEGDGFGCFSEQDRESLGKTDTAEGLTKTP